MAIRLTVRTKLLAIIVPPLIGLSAFSAVGVLDRLNDQRDAEVREARSAALESLSGLTTSLQMERSAIAAQQTPEVLTARRGATDAAFTEVINRVDKISNATSSLPVLDTQRLGGGLALAQSDIVTQRKADTSVTAGRADVVAKYGQNIDVLIQDSSLISSGLGASSAAWHWLARSSEAESRLLSVGLVYQEQLPLAPTAISEITVLNGQAQTNKEAFRSTADATQNAHLDQLLLQASTVESDKVLASLTTAPTVGIDGDAAKDIAHLGEERLNSLGNWIQSSYHDVGVAASKGLETARRGAQFFFIGAGVAVLLAGLVGLSFARSISKSLRRLTKSARMITTEQLPAMVDSIQSGRPVAPFTSVNEDRRDEFGDVSRALNALGGAITEVAGRQQEALKKGIGDIFVNLARRNQTLLDRQIEFIDRLESNEQDPDQLDSLFKLDHLATRMRRNAESLLVLAEAETPRRRGQDVSITDVVRVAVGEVEDFSRIAIRSVEPASMHGGAAVDVAHLLSELMENGTQYSPPDRPVEVHGSWQADGTYLLAVSDQGVGMNEDQFAGANKLFRDPPRLGFGMNRSLGLVVAAKLASRHDIEVTLGSAIGGGVTAHLVLPAALVHRGEAASTPHAPVEERPTVAMSQVGAPQDAPSANPPVEDHVWSTPPAATPATQQDDYWTTPQPVQPAALQHDWSQPQPVAADPASVTGFAPTAPETTSPFVSQGEDYWTTPQPVEPATPVGGFGIGAGAYNNSGLDNMSVDPFIPPINALEPYQPEEPMPHAAAEVSLGWTPGGEFMSPESVEPASTLEEALAEGVDVESAHVDFMASLSEQEASEMPVETSVTPRTGSSSDPSLFIERMVEPTVEGVSSSGLPVRRKPTTIEPPVDPGERMGATKRSATDKRGLLSRYRSGLATGRAVASSDEPNQRSSADGNDE